MKNLDGEKWVVITGACGHVGSRLSSELLSCGFGLILIDLPQAFENVEHEEWGKSSERIKHLKGDLSDKEFVKSVIETVGSSGHSIYALVNNAAFVGSSTLSGWSDGFGPDSVEAWSQAIWLNLSVPYILSEGIFPFMQNGGSVVNVASIYGFIAPRWELYKGTQMINPAAYGASKAGLIQLTKWHSSKFGTKVRVNAISPGGIERMQPESFVEKYKSMSHQRAMLDESDVVDAILFLLDSKSKRITGHNLVVDAGFSA